MEKDPRGSFFLFLASYVRQHTVRRGRERGVERYGWINFAPVYGSAQCASGEGAKTALTSYD